MISSARRGDVYVARIARPPHNSLDDDLATAIETALDACISERCTVLHLRSDEPSFCAGTETRRLSAWVEQGADALESDNARFDALFRRLETAAPVVLAEIGGPALGAGLGLALACDLRIAATQAKFGVPEAKFGVLPPGGTMMRIARVAGPQTARWLLLTADLVDGNEALRLGLVDRAVPRDALEAAAAALAARIAALSPGALRSAKAVLDAGADPMLSREVSQMRALFTSPPDRERFAAFVARLSGKTERTGQPAQEARTTP